MPSSPSGLLDQLLSPAPQRKRVERLTGRPFAHRGLHGGGRIENSRSAFEAALALGHGIELDVQASADGRAMVFHDAELDRLTDEHGPLSERGADALQRIRLKDSTDSIPTLEEIVALVAGRAPLLVEVKAPGRHVQPLCLSVLRSLEGYRGPVGVMSFNPEVGRWFYLNAPRITRGLVVTEGGRKWRGGLLRRLAMWRSRPDFLAYDIRDLPSRFAARARARGIPVFTWTCRGEEQVNRARLHADQIIFEETA